MTLYNLADDFVEALTTLHFNRKSAYVEEAKRIFPCTRVSIFPPKASKFTTEEIKSLRAITHKVPATSRQCFINYVLSIFKSCTSYGLIQVLTFRDVVINGLLYPEYTVFVIDGLVMDIWFNQVNVPLREYIQKLFKENTRIYLNKSKCVYYPNGHLGYYLNFQQWSRLTGSLGMDYDESYYYNDTWRATYAYGPVDRRNTNG